MIIFHGKNQDLDERNYNAKKERKGISDNNTLDKPYYNI